VLIDGDCALCSRFARFVIAHDPGGIFRFAPLQSSFARDLVAPGAPPSGLSSVVLVEGGAVFVRSEASLRVLSRLGLPWRIAGAARILPGPVRDFGYDLIARNRYRIFGKTTACGMLDAAERARFLAVE
jgi:predicted DCC family thiol-disulfide oxidoreductase YuxK